MMRPSSPEGCGEAAEGGSVLIEALVAIGMLAVLVATVAGVHAAAASAVAAADLRVDAARTAERALEAYAVGLDPDPALDGDLLLEPFRVVLPDHPCDTSTLAGQPALRVRVDVAPSALPVTVTGPLPLQVAGPDHPGAVPALIALHGPGGAVDATLIRPDGSVATLDVQRASCLGAHAVTPGVSALTVTGVDAPLIDPLHRSPSVAPLLLSVLDRPIHRAWALAPAASVTVHVDPAGARPPDVAGPLGLAWLVRGDDARERSPSGATRALHPGRVTIVASACGNPDARGTASTVDVGPGEARTVGIILPNVEVRGIGSRTDATLRLDRAAGCGDGAAVPSLLWSGGLSDGMRIALPHGTWDAQLRSPSMGALTGTVQVVVGPEGALLVLP